MTAPATLQDQVVTMLAEIFDRMTPAIRQIMAELMLAYQHVAVREMYAGDLEPFGFREVLDW